MTDDPQRYSALFSPIEIRGRTMKNRVWMTAHGTQLAKGTGRITQPYVDYCAERAKGGVGAITLEAMLVHESGQTPQGKISGYDEAVVPGYRSVAAAVQPEDCLLFAQPWHRGRAMTGKASRMPAWGPSPVPDPVAREIPHRMTTAEIDQVIEGYVRAARHAVTAGLDGVEVHGFAHGYLVGQFLSPATNHRTDAYGGTPAKRLRLAMEVLQAVRAEAGASAVVGLRINGDDGPIEEGLRTGDWQRLAETFAESGLVDYLSVSQGTYHDRMLIFGATPTPHGHQLEATRQIKQAVPGLPVIAAGRIVSPELAESIIDAGTADIVGMARTLIADPNWVRKAQEARTEDIRPCVGANWCLAMATDSPIACVHNPAAGREADLGTGTLVPADAPKDVTIVGGGVAGLRTAYTAARRGHRVTLYEASERLGGQVDWIAQIPAYREYYGIVSWLLQQIEQLEVRVHTSTPLTADDLRAARPDAVVVATGSVPLRHGWTAGRPARWADGKPTVPGADQWNVITALEVFDGKTDIGPNVVVYDDLGDRQAVGIAEYLADRRHQVDVYTPLGQVAPGLAASRDQPQTVRRLRQMGVRMHPYRELLGIHEDRATFRDVHTDEPHDHEPADAVVLVTGNAAKDELFHELEGSGIPVTLVGDAAAPRNIFSAIWDGEQAARAL